MPGTATGKYLKVPPRKAREVVELIRGLPVEQAQQVVQFSKRRAARFIGKVLKSAVSNAQQAKEGGAKSLFVTEAVVNEGPTVKKVFARARGVRNVMKRRTSHITIVVEEQ